MLLKKKTNTCYKSDDGKNAFHTFKTANNGNPCVLILEGNQRIPMTSYGDAWCGGGYQIVKMPGGFLEVTKTTP